MLDYRHPDLTRHPPRSPRVRLGGFAHLPRILDKARASVSGQNGLYEYGTMLDQHFFTFTGIDMTAFLDQVAKQKSDGEILQWVLQRMSPPRAPAEIQQWSQWLESLGPASATGHAWLAERISGYGPQREDISSYFDHLDLDDYVAFGGLA
jgi:hypothetical protein